MRFVEELDSGDQVITYFQDGVNHGPFLDRDAAVEAAYEDLILQATVSE